MSNEDYWINHEIGELYCRKYMSIVKALNDGHISIKEANRRIRNFIRLCGTFYLCVLNASDMKQKQGRLIVGGKVSE